MLLKTLIISIILIALAFIGFAITILFKKGGHFPNTHVGENTEMKKRGLTCASNENLGCNGVSGQPECSSCSIINNVLK
ncbi:MAG: hypothetical protein A2X08_06920 [Bacteroidetes bacterium GWA2_32_17]|nr:MAG: hypothetical protein A2X08_06920 [Bacteroidetes bacterium GWA2_32_17]